MKFADWPACAQEIALFKIDDGAALMAEAVDSERKRAHILLHENHADPVQRMVISLSQDTYIQPHKHSEQWEMLLPLGGSLAVLTFDEAGKVKSRIELESGKTLAAQIPAGLNHTLITLSDTALMVELKAGPFRPAEFCDVFPAEGSTDSSSIKKWLRSAKAGDQWID